MPTFWLLNIVYMLRELSGRLMSQEGQESLSGQPMILVELSFQINYGLINLVQDKEIVSSGFIGSQKVKH